MPIPGLKARYETRAKVRIGEKRQSQRGTAYPAAVDYFVCDDAGFAAKCGDKPKTIRVRFPYDSVSDNFSTGMEWWMGALLACYSKGEPESDPIAYRRQTIKRGEREVSLIDPDDVKRGAPMGQDRQPIACRFRECPHFGANAQNKECRVMGRLVFFIDGVDGDGVFQLDTKSWNSIEELTGALGTAAARGPLSGRVFELSVAFRRKGADRFPVLAIQEADVEPNSPKDIAKVDALLVIDRGLQQQLAPRTVLAAALDLTNPGWRERPEIIEKIKEVGPAVALKSMKDRLDAELAA